MREIIALQLGGYANHVATHFWNTQYAYVTDTENMGQDPLVQQVLFGSRGSGTFFPRSVVVDKTDQVISNFGGCEPSDVKVQSWGAECEVIAQQRQPPSDLQRLWAEGGIASTFSAHSVRSWYDYSYAEYEPSSFALLPRICSLGAYDDADASNFDAELAYTTSNWGESLLDEKLRRHSEDCDSLQGLLVFTETRGGYGRLATRFLTDARDEYPKTTFFTHAFAPFTCVQTLEAFTDLGHTLVVPWRSHALTCLADEVLAYELSAWAAIAIETVTLPARLQVFPVPLADLCARLDAPMASLRLSISGSRAVPQSLFDHVASGPDDSKSQRVSTTYKVTRNPTSNKCCSISTTGCSTLVETHLAFPNVAPFPFLELLHPIDVSLSAQFDFKAE